MPVHAAFHRSQELREKFEEMAKAFDEVEVPADLKQQVLAVLTKHEGFSWEDAVQVVLDEGQIDHVREKKEKARKESGDFTDDEDDEDL
jgi:hypothetical protein